MEENLKQLLLKDLCARLPYGVMVKDTYNGHYGRLKRISGSTVYYLSELNVNYLDELLERIKPYLRPMSSMTEDEDKEYTKVIIKSQDCIFEDSESAITMVNDWLLSKGFDVRGLIKKGLALEAPKGMYNK